MACLSGSGFATHGCGALAVSVDSYPAHASGIDMAEPRGVVHICKLARVLRPVRRIMVADIDKWRVQAGRILSGAIIISAVASGLVVLQEVNNYPRTDDAEILANFI